MDYIKKLMVQWGGCRMNSTNWTTTIVESKGNKGWDKKGYNAI